MSDPEFSKSDSSQRLSPPKPLPNAMRTREPWPMWPIALAIILFIGVYTWINISYRKEGHAYEPFQAMMDRKNAIVEKNFYDWYSLKTDRLPNAVTPKDSAEATSRAFPNALDEVVPEQLKYYMPGRPILVQGFVKTDSPNVLTPGEPLPVTLHVSQTLATDERLQLLAFYKEGELFLLAALFVEEENALSPETLSSETAPVTFAVPTTPIAAETVSVRFLTHDRVSEWQIENLDPSAAVVEESEEPEA